MAIAFQFIGLFSNPILVFIAFFIWIGAGQEASVVRMQSALAGVLVREAMLTNFQTLTPENTLGDAAGLVLTRSQQDFPVARDGHVEGVLTRSDLLAALARRGREARVAEAVRRECLTAEASEMLEAVLARLQGHDCHTLPVTEHGALVGLVTIGQRGGVSNDSGGPAEERCVRRASVAAHTSATGCADLGSRPSSYRLTTPSPRPAERGTSYPNRAAPISRAALYPVQHRLLLGRLRHLDIATRQRLCVG